MAHLKIGDRANLIVEDSEIEVTIVGSGNGRVAVEGMNKGQRVQYMVKPDDLLRLKGAFIDVRGIVFTTSVHHPGEQAEIIKRGEGTEGRAFFCVQFKDDSTEWLHESDVCIEVVPRKLIVDI